MTNLECFWLSACTINNNGTETTRGKTKNTGFWPRLDFERWPQMKVVVIL